MCGRLVIDLSPEMITEIYGIIRQIDGISTPDTTLLHPRQYPSSGRMQKAIGSLLSVVGSDLLQGQGYLYWQQPDQCPVGDRCGETVVPVSIQAPSVCYSNWWVLRMAAAGWEKKATMMPT